MSKKLLIIGMLNSVHIANWLERIADENVEIHLFASRRYRKLHPKIVELRNRPGNVIKVKSIFRFQLTTTFLEALIDKELFKFLSKYSRRNRLRNLIVKGNYDVIHAIELQNAGYLLKTAIIGEDLDSKIVVTNWGSDIYYYGQFSEHQEKIRGILEIADAYSAECKRDYELALKYGFTGVLLPVIPNSTSFNSAYFEKDILRARERFQVIIKCYGGEFGRGDILLQFSEYALKNYPSLNIFAYSITPDLVAVARRLSTQHKARFRFTTARRPIPHSRILHEFELSRVYIGASKSDGISTSFLEALATGAYPIQTSTSCAQEWIDEGVIGSIVSEDIDEISSSFDEVIGKFEFLEKAQIVNRAHAQLKLSFDELAQRAKDFY